MSAADVSEEDFTTAVIHYAMLRGWMVSHARPAKTAKGWRTLIQGHKGAPDLLLARNGVVILAELKTSTGRLSTEQRLWAHHINGALYRLWRPTDWPKIADELR